MICLSGCGPARGNGLNGRHGPKKWPTDRTMGRTLGPQHGGGPARSARGPTWPAPCRAGPTRCTSIVTGLASFEELAFFS